MEMAVNFHESVPIHLEVNGHISEQDHFNLEVFVSLFSHNAPLLKILCKILFSALLNL